MPDLDPRPYTVVTVDIERYSDREILGQFDLRDGLRRILDEAAVAARVDRSLWHTQDGGDAELALVAADVPKTRLAYDFVEELAVALGRFNAPRAREHRMRLRVALHHGDAIRDGTGYPGPAPVVACRLRDADAARVVLRHVADAGADLVSILSDTLYADVVGHRGLRRRDFQRVRVRLKEFDSAAWVRVPGERPPWPVGRTGDGTSDRGPAVPTGDAVDPPRPAPNAGRVVTGGTFSGLTNLGDGPMVGRDYNDYGTARGNP